MAEGVLMAFLLRAPKREDTRDEALRSDEATGTLIQTWHGPAGPGR